MFQINHKTISLESPQFNIVKTYFQQGEVPSILSNEQINHTNYINNSTVLLHKSIINKVGPFKPEKYEDWEYWKKVVVHTPCYYMDYALVYYTVSVENRSTLKHYIY